MIIVPIRIAINFNDIQANKKADKLKAASSISNP